MPKLRYIDASFNKLAALPAELKGPLSPVLVDLNLSNNKLQDIPKYFQNSGLQFLDVSSNHIQHVPVVILTLSKLHTLNLSGNLGLESVPYGLGGLRNLTLLGMDDLPYILNLPSNEKGKISPLSFLRSRARGMQEISHYQVVVVGSNGYAAALDDVSQVVSKRAKRKQFTFLQFRNSSELLFFQRVFALPSSIYLVVWDCENNQHPNSLLRTLLHLSIYASTSQVIVAACWKQAISPSKESDVQKQLDGCLWNDIRSQVHLQFVCLDKDTVTDRVYSSFCLLDSIKNLAQTHLTKVTVPNSYAVLVSAVQKTLSILKHENRPFLITEGYFWDIVRSSPQHDLAGHKELALVTTFLCSLGTIKHLPSTCLSKSDTYVLDAQWFLGVLSGLLQQRQNIRSLSALFPAKCLIDFLECPYLQSPLPYSLHMFASQHGLAVATSSHEILIPSMLLNSMPSSTCSDFTSQYNIRRVYTFRLTPATFWGRLIAHLLMNMSQLVSSADTENSGEMSNLPNEEMANWDYWSKGMVVWLAGSQLLFSVEAIDPLLTQTYCEGLEIRVSKTLIGMRAMNIIMGTINSLLLNWYSELCKTVDILVPCPQCISEKSTPHPFLFPIQDCCLAATHGISLQCPRHQSVPFHANGILQDLYQSEEQNELSMFASPELLSVNLEEDTLCISPAPSKTVFEGVYKKIKVAIKPFPHPVSNPARQSTSESTFLDFWHEFIILRHISNSNMSPYLVNLMVASVGPLGLVFPCAYYRSLEEVILDGSIRLTQLLRVRIVYQLSVSLEALHSIKVIHRHVCLANIMVYSLNPNDTDNIKLGGFSEASFALNQGVATKLCGAFPAPEMCKSDNEYDERVDVFAYAFTAYEILTRKKLCFREGVRFQAASSQSDRPSLHSVSTMTPYFTPLLERCWGQNASKRPFFTEIVRFFNNPVNVLTREAQMLSDSHEFYAAAVHFQRSSDNYIKHVYVCSGILSQDDSAILSYFSLPHLTLKQHTALPSRFIICVCCTSQYLWISFQHKYVQIYAASTLKLIKKIQFNHHVLCMSAGPNVIYLGLENGDVHMYNLCSGTPLQNPAKSKAVCRGTPLRVIESLEDFVICASNKMCYRLHPDTLEEWQRILTLPEKRADVRCTAMAIDRGADKEYLWVGFRRSQEVLVFDGLSGDKTYSISCCRVLNMERSEVHVLTILVVLDTVWVGLNTGHVLCFSAFSPTPLLLTYFKLHKENVRQLTLLHPSYMGPSSISLLESCSEVCENDHHALPYSIPHVITPQSVPILSCGQGLQQALPRVGSGGCVLITQGSQTSSSSLHAVVLDGPDSIGAKKLEYQTQRKASFYMEGASYVDSSIADSTSLDLSSLPLHPATHEDPLTPTTPVTVGESLYSATYSATEQSGDLQSSDWVLVSKHDIPPQVPLMSEAKCDGSPVGKHSRGWENFLATNTSPQHGVHQVPTPHLVGYIEPVHSLVAQNSAVHSTETYSEPLAHTYSMRPLEEDELVYMELKNEPLSGGIPLVPSLLQSREIIGFEKECSESVEILDEQEHLTVQQPSIVDSGGEDEDLDPYLIMRSAGISSCRDDFHSVSLPLHVRLPHSIGSTPLHDGSSKNDCATSNTTQAVDINTSTQSQSSPEDFVATQEYVDSLNATPPGPVVP